MENKNNIGNASSLSLGKVDLPELIGSAKSVLNNEIAARHVEMFSAKSNEDKNLSNALVNAFGEKSKETRDAALKAAIMDKILGNSK
ncbi:MAG: hypothetical protein R3Y43_05025 [Alphaproteobacteria bacterium]